MVQPIFRHTNEGDSSNEPSTLDDSGILEDDYPLRQFRTEEDDLEGAVGYSSNRRFSYWGATSSSTFGDGSPQRRHSVGEFSRRRHRSENNIGQRPNYNFNRGERRPSSQFRNDYSQGNGAWDLLTPNHNHFSTRCVYPPGVSHETVIVGSQLYLRFLREQIQQLNLQTPECLDPSHANPPPLRSLEILNIGNNLRQVANEFAHSAHRHRVLERAESVNLENLNFNSFTNLLYGLFSGGVTSERVVVLFFFCSDLGIRALRNSLRERFDFITYWSQRFIMEKFSVWVQEHGGWAEVLQQSVNQAYKFMMISFCCVAIVTMCVYIRKNIR